MSAKVRVKRVLLTCLAACGYAMALPIACRQRRLRSGGELRVLTYHSVSPWRKHETNVLPSVFAAHMRLLSRMATVTPLEAPQESVRRRCTRGMPRAAVTFDDGYASVLFHAEPIMRAHQIGATCFVTVGYAGTDRLLPHDAGATLHEARLLRWDEVREMEGRGVRIGSHCLSHRRLAALDDASLAAELALSRQFLARELGKEVFMLSLPFGRTHDFDDRVWEAARGAGYTTVCTAQYGWNCENSDRSELKRIGIDSSDSLFTLRAKLDGALDILTLAERPAARRLVAIANHILHA